MTVETKAMSFREWCGLNGRRWQGAKDFKEFAKNGKDYEAYLEAWNDASARKQVEEELRSDGIIEDPDIDGGLTG